MAFSIFLVQSVKNKTIHIRVYGQWRYYINPLYGHKKISIDTYMVIYKYKLGGGVVKVRIRTFDKDNISRVLQSYKSFLLYTLQNVTFMQNCKKV